MEEKEAIRAIIDTNLWISFKQLKNRPVKPGNSCQHLRHFLVGQVERRPNPTYLLGSVFVPPNLRMVFFYFGEGIVRQNRVSENT